MVNAIDSTSERLSEFIERTEVTGFKYFPDRKGHLLSLASTDKRCMMQIPAAMCAHYNDHPSEVTVAKLRSAGRDWFVFFSSRLGRLVALEVLPFYTVFDALCTDGCAHQSIITRLSNLNAAKMEPFSMSYANMHFGWPTMNCATMSSKRCVRAAAHSQKSVTDCAPKHITWPSGNFVRS